MRVTHSEDFVTHAVVGAMETKECQIAQTAEFFRVMSSSLYSDKPLAVARETLCNAWDAHIEAGCTDTPIKVTLTEDKLIIQDFGNGIPDDMIIPIYGTWGGSTKTDNDGVTGGFGLGCKAPFSIVDHFEEIIEIFDLVDGDEKLRKHFGFPDRPAREDENLANIFLHSSRSRYWFGHDLKDETEILRKIPLHPSIDAFVTKTKANPIRNYVSWLYLKSKNDKVLKSQQQIDDWKQLRPIIIAILES